MSIYLDASFLVALVVNDAFTQRADAALRGAMQSLFISDFGAAEVTSTIARLHRTAALSRKLADAAFVDFDAWCANSATRITTVPSDIRDAESFIRNLRFNLRTPDAIAIALRLGAELATFDTRMADCARALGAGVAAL